MTRDTWEAWIRTGAWQSFEHTSLPLAPGLLGHVLRLAGNDDPTAGGLIALVRHDQVLTAQVLRLANSAAVGALREVTTVDGAVVRLGTKTVRNMVMSLCLASWSAEDLALLEGEHFMEHAIGTAYLARAAGALTGIDGEDAFVAGLLHDIGKILLIRLRSAYVRSIGSPPAPDVFRRVVADCHAESGALLLQMWGVPQVLRDTIRWHHEPLASPDVYGAATIWLANALSHRYGFGVRVTDEQTLIEDPVARAAGLTSAWLDDMDRRAATIFETAMRQLAA